MLALCCLMLIVYTPLYNSHPITVSLTPLVDTQQSAVPEVIFNIVENNFQPSYWETYTYIYVKIVGS